MTAVAHFERSAGKVFRHFREADVVYDMLDLLRARHRIPYAALAIRMQEQIKDFFDREFSASKEPTRFAGTSDVMVRERLIVPLSGGIDSTVVTYLATNAVGTRRLLPVTMPARPHDPSVEHARLVREELGHDEVDALYEIDIQPMIEAHMQVMLNCGDQVTLGTHYSNQSREQKMRSGNVGSRVRIAVLYDLQRAIRGRILGTGNRTEFCQGYGCKFGTPISYDFGVLDELYKVDIYELAKTLDVPAEIIAADPSTGYFEGQTHEGALGATLEEQDVVSYILFELGVTVDDAMRMYGLSEEYATTMQHRWDVSEHKRLLNAGQERVSVTGKAIPM